MIGGAVQALAAALTVSITGGIPVPNVPAGSAAPSLSRIGSVQLPAANVGLVPEGNPLAWGENRTARPATQAVIDAWVQTSAVGELPDVPGQARADEIATVLSAAGLGYVDPAANTPPAGPVGGPGTARLALVPL